MNDKIKLIKYYSYRSARPNGWRITLPREMMRELEVELNKQNGTRPDNHTCFLFMDANHQTQAVMFHDFVCVFTDSLQEGMW